MEESNKTNESRDQTNESIKESEPDPSGDEPVKLGTKIRLFIQCHWRGLVIVLTPIVCLAVVWPLPGEKYGWCAYALLNMAVFWVTECIPLPVTSFLPVFLFPITDVMNTFEVCKAYFNDTIIMFLGSLFLASSVEQSGLHIRIALGAIRLIGYSHYRLLFAMGFVTMFVSMWITNTAATTMMVPMIFALLRVFEENKLGNLYEERPDGELQATDITTCYFCMATFSATIGGIGTLVGTGTNLVFKGLFQSSYPTAKEYLSFPLFSAFAIPYMLVMEALCYLCMILLYFGFLRPNSAAAKQSTVSKEGMEAAKRAVGEHTAKIGSITFAEVLTLILFSGAMFSFFCRSPLIFDGWGDKIDEYFGRHKKFVKDSACALSVAFLMLLLPGSMQIFQNCKAKFHEDLPNKPVASLLQWAPMNQAMPWSFTFLLGGGFALSTAARKEHSDLNGKIGEILKKLKDLPNYLLILMIIIFTVFITNFASNVAMANVVVPIAMQMAKEIGQNPLWYNIAAGFSASYCFCLPVGTPGNLIVQSAAKIPTKKMIIAGTGPTITTIFTSFMFICFFAPVIWPDINTLPEWATAP